MVNAAARSLELLRRTSFAMVVCSAFLVAMGETASGQSFEGPATAKDGDDLVIGGMDVRLFGIDAFELAQMCEADGKAYACGEFAKQALSKKVLGRTVSCEQRL